jgi:cell division protein FtsI (penicillin-binding protein 3)
MKLLSGLRAWAGRRADRAASRARGSRRQPGASVNYATSPLLASRTPPWRSKFLVAIVGGGFCLLVGRAVSIQMVSNDFYQRQGEARYAHTLPLQASRGNVLDRNGQVLATSIAAESLWVIPKDFDADKKQRRVLAGLLGMKPQDLDDKVDDDSKFVWLRRQVEEDTAAKIRAMDIKGLHELREYKRKYPEGEAAAHVVGFTSVEEKGQEGIELAFEKSLAGHDGSRNVIKDRLGRIVEDTGNSVPPVDGRDVTLTIDSKVQFFAYQRIRDAVIQQKAKAGSAVVIDTQTGDILALANYPSYVPGDRGGMTGDKIRNRALTDVFEPGSTMKPFIAGWALETNRVTPNTVLQTAPGRVTIAGASISDSHAHGNLTVTEAIQVSSNIGAARMGLMFSAKEMWELYAKAGFGQKPQLGFPGAVTGRLRPYKTWRPIEQATMAYGYGLSASLFQLARAYTVFANDGVLENVSMLRQAAPGPGARVFKPETVKELLTMLQMVTSPGGTAPKARTMGYSVGGKSGTAYKAEGRGYAQNKYRPWFVGLAPISHPRIVVAVMIDEPGAGLHFGGDVAAPVFSQVVSQTLPLLGVAPDLDVRTQITQANVVQTPEN